MCEWLRESDTFDGLAYPKRNEMAISRRGGRPIGAVCLLFVILAAISANARFASAILRSPPPQPASATITRSPNPPSPPTNIFHPDLCDAVLSYEKATGKVNHLKSKREGFRLYLLTSYSSFAGQEFEKPNRGVDPHPAPHPLK